MPDAANPSGSLARSLILFILLFPCTLEGQKAAQSDIDPNPEDQIQAVIVLARHGVCAPIESESRSSASNAQPWPSWPVADGVLTPHGAEALKLHTTAQDIRRCSRALPATIRAFTWKPIQPSARLLRPGLWCPLLRVNARLTCTIA
jgi:hypothetical protein